MSGSGKVPGLRAQQASDDWGLSRFDIRTGLWHSISSNQVAKAAMETSRRVAVVQRVRTRCEPDTKAPLKILPELPTERARGKGPE